MDAPSAYCSSLASSARRAPRADEIVFTPEGMGRATEFSVVHCEPTRRVGG